MSIQEKGYPHLDTLILPGFQKYKQEHESWIPDFNLWSYLNLRADYDLAVAFSKLFWPDFIEVDGCVLLATHYSPENFQEWKKNCKGDLRAVEAMLNHTHIWDLFLNSNEENFPIQLHEYLAQIILISWRHALQEAFPDKQFTFSYLTAEEGYGPEISFYQKEHP